MNYPKDNLTGKYPGNTYQNLVQYAVESSSFVDGVGNEVLTPSGSISSSYARTASYASKSAFSPVIFSNFQIINGHPLILSTDTNTWYSLGVTDDGSGSFTTNLTATVNTGSSYASGSFYSINSFALYTTSSNYASQSGYATSSLSASWASSSISASYSQTASYATNGGGGITSGGSYNISCSWASSSLSSSFVLTASLALTASYLTNNQGFVTANLSIAYAIALG